jgi:hypothetical protein
MLTECPVLAHWQGQASSIVLGAGSALSALLYSIHSTFGPEHCAGSCKCTCTAASAASRRGSVTLLHGPAGCGKTLIARWLAEKLGLPSHILDHRLLHPRVGGTEASLAAQLRKARAAAPCVLVIDELQALAPATACPGSTTYRLLIMLAQQLNALCSESVFVLGLCRQPEHVHPVSGRAIISCHLSQPSSPSLPPLLRCR